MPVAIVTGSGGLIGSESVRHFVQAGYDVIGHGEAPYAIEHRIVDGIEMVGRTGEGIAPEMQVPDQPRPGPQRLYVGFGLRGHRHRNVECFGPDPPSASIGTDTRQCLQIGQHDVDQDARVIGP